VHCGAHRIFVVDPVEWKREQALKFGATQAYADIDAALVAIAGITVGRMARKVIVTVGRVDGADLDKYVSITAKGGTCVITAMGSVVETDATLNLSCSRCCRNGCKAPFSAEVTPSTTSH